MERQWQAAYFVGLSFRFPLVRLFDDFLQLDFLA
jgi:hypothetical protein